MQSPEPPPTRIKGGNMKTNKWKTAYPVVQEGVIADVMGWQAATGYDPVFEKLKEMGYDGIELLVRNFNTLDAGRLRQALDRHGLKAAAVGTSPMQKMDGLFLIHSDDTVRKEAKRQAFLQLALCAELGAKACIGKFRGTISKEPGCTWEDLAEVMHEIGREAQRLGVTVVVEPQNPSGINNLNGIGDTLEWLRALQEPQIHLHADTFHMNLTEDNEPQSLRAAGFLGKGGEIGFFHISDTKRLVPGRGELDFDEIFAALEDISYEGYISPEIAQRPDSETAARESAAFLGKYRS